MRSYEWALFQSDWCPYKRKVGYKRDNRDAEAEERPGEDIAGRRPSASREASKGTKP